MNFFNLLFLGKYNFYHKTHWYEALFAKVVGAGRKLIAKFLKIKGNTIVWNQIMAISSTASSTTNGITYVNNNDGSYSFYTDNGGATATTSFTIASKTNEIQPNHVYCLTGNASGSSSTTWMLSDYYDGVLNYHFKEADINKVVRATPARLDIRIRVYNGAVITNPVTVRPQIFDLTAMFGATKADEIYAMEQSQSGSGVNYFRSLFPLPYYQYEQGKLLSFSGGTIGKNLFDESTIEQGYYHPSDGSLVPNAIYRNVRLNLIKGTYTISTSEAFYYLRWWDGANHDIADSRTSYTFTTGNSGKFQFCFRKNDSSAITEPFTVQIEKGSIATPYEPYKFGNTIKTVGFNLFDKSKATIGRYMDGQGNIYGDPRMAMSDYISVIPNRDYYTNANAVGQTFIARYFDVNKKMVGSSSLTSAGVFNVGNAHYIIVQTLMANTPLDELVVNLSSDKNGKYEPYQSFTLDIPTSTYFPNGMKSAGSVYDELTNSKAITRVGEVDLGSLTWGYDSSHTLFYSSQVADSANVDYTSMPNIVCDKYIAVKGSGYNSGTDKSISINDIYGIKKVTIKDSSFTDYQTLKTSLSGVMLQYELADEEVVDIDSPLKLNYQVWEGGTEQLLPVNTDVPTTSPILADIKYPDGERDDQYFTYRQYLPNSRMMSMALNTIMGRNVEFNQEALDILMKGE